ncbi:MAG: hypothetical protein K5760_05140 [Clostridium sp.]|nr:hypothetical protein [Clostridium sp.]
MAAEPERRIGREIGVRNRSEEPAVEPAHGTGARRKVLRKRRINDILLN